MKGINECSNFRIYKEFVAYKTRHIAKRGYYNIEKYNFQQANIY